MDLNKAASILEIDLNTIRMDNLTQDYIKKRFHKLALINHPDKNGNSLEATNKFQQINEAYKYLSNELKELDITPEPGFVSSNDQNESNNTNTRYIYFLSLFIGSIIDGQYKDAIKSVIKEIVTYGLKQVALERIFDELDKESALEVYSFIVKYKHVLHIGNDILDFVSSLIKKKYNNDRVFILNPSIVDLLESNIFKLYIDEELYLVPLWHNELYFDTKRSDNGESQGEIIVLCNPDLPANIVIDEDNNIHVQMEVEGSKLLDLLKIETSLSGSSDPETAFAQGSTETAFVSLSIGNKDFRIPLNELHIKQEQLYRLSKQGISQVSENDIYNISCKSDIIVKIHII
jgi:DnaJ-class molecular chaperone with C-terminal Zn finger domain